jgi:hypothetical protein
MRRAAVFWLPTCDSQRPGLCELASSFHSSIRSSQGVGVGGQTRPDFDAAAASLARMPRLI